VSPQSPSVHPEATNDRRVASGAKCPVVRGQDRWLTISPHSTL